MQEAYEITFIVSEGAKSDMVEKALKDVEAEIVTSNELGLKTFAYPIKKKISGNYFAIEFKLEGEKLQGLEKELKAEKDLIRYLIIKALRKPIETNRRERTPEEVEAANKKAKPEVKTAPKFEEDKTTEEAQVEKPVVEVIETPAEPEEIIEKVDSTPVQEKVAEEPAVEIAEVKEEKVAKKPRAKAEKLSAEELDKKLEELVKE